MKIYSEITVSYLYLQCTVYILRQIFVSFQLTSKYSTLYKTTPDNKLWTSNIEIFTSCLDDENQPLRLSQTIRCTWYTTYTRKLDAIICPAVTFWIKIEIYLRISFSFLCNNSNFTLPHSKGRNFNHLWSQARIWLHNLVWTWCRKAYESEWIKLDVATLLVIAPRMSSASHCCGIVE